MRLVLVSGALIGIDRGERRVAALIELGRRSNAVAASQTSDAIDALLALLVRPSDQVLTSDSDGLEALLDARKVKALVVSV